MKDKWNMLLLSLVLTIIIVPFHYSDFLFDGSFLPLGALGALIWLLHFLFYIVLFYTVIDVVTRWNKKRELRQNN
jgi:hypothetical protein